jgi:hypothetical protein
MDDIRHNELPLFAPVTTATLLVIDIVVNNIEAKIRDSKIIYIYYIKCLY